MKGGELVLGPFQGPIACTRIGFGKGVCGTCWKEKKVLIVPNVDEFPGHIACSSDSKSEIVLPVFAGGEVVLVLDVDSDKLNDFDETDMKYLSEVARARRHLVLIPLILSPRIKNEFATLGYQTLSVCKPAENGSNLPWRLAPGCRSQVR